MADGAIQREAGLNVIRIGRLFELGEVTRVAVFRGAGELVIDMAKVALHTYVRACKRERGF